jgi:hypothetical protein
MRNHRGLALGTMLIIASAVGAISSAAQVITVSSPAKNSQVLSPVHYVASATNSNCPQGISGMRIYIASHMVAYKVQAGSIDTHLTLTPGSYKTTVQAWDRCGNVSKTAVNITVAPTGLKPARFVYVADGLAKLWGFNANPSTGVLSPTAQGPVLTNDRVVALAVDKGGYRLYGTFGDTNIPPRGGVYAFFIDRRNGHLAAVPGSPFSTTPYAADAIAVHPSGKFVFVGTNSSVFSHGILAFAVNADGSLTSVNTTPIPTVQV